MEKPRSVAPGLFHVWTGSGFLKRKRRGVDAVAQAGGPGAVEEHMPQMRAATDASCLHAVHSVARVFIGFNRAWVRRQPKTWPSTAGVKLLVRAEQERSATGAMISSILMVLVERA